MLSAFFSLSLYKIFSKESHRKQMEIIPNVLLARAGKKFLQQAGIFFWQINGLSSPSFLELSLLFTSSFPCLLALLKIRAAQLIAHPNEVVHLVLPGPSLPTQPR